MRRSNFELRANAVVIKLPERNLHQSLQDMVDQGTMDVFTAVDVRNTSVAELRPFISVNVYHAMQHGRFDHSECDSKGAIGCYLSHYAIWEEIARRDDTAPGVFIVEDDAKLLRPLTLETDETDADIVFLHWKSNDIFQKCTLEDVSACMSTLGYYVTPPTPRSWLMPANYRQHNKSMRFCSEA